jgi:toxin FitB
MILLDSNIIIYSYQPSFHYLKPLVIDTANSVSTISHLEILGFHKILPNEQIYCETVFSVLNQFPIDKTVIEEAIRLRKFYKMKLADSIVAATALINNAELYTRNTSDFKGIKGLIVVNPMP